MGQPPRAKRLLDEQQPFATASERRADAAQRLELQDVQHLDGAVLDVQHPICVEVEPLGVDPRQELRHHPSPIQNADHLVVVQVDRLFVVGLVVGRRGVGTGVQRVGADEQLDAVPEP